MSKKGSESNVEAVERRHHWRDRRSGTDRRSMDRVKLSSFDCRSGEPRRTADVGGELAEGDIWWKKSVTGYE